MVIAERTTLLRRALVAAARSARQYSTPKKYDILSVGVPAESAAHERRVALTPAKVAEMRTKWGVASVLVQSGAGAAASFPDSAYAAAGATVVSAKEAFAADVVLKARAPAAAAGRPPRRAHDPYPSVSN